jgi:hypothetical protein
MATPLDIGLLQNVGIIFPFLLVIVFVYALLTKTQVLGKDAHGLNAFIAFCLGVATLFSPIAVKTIQLMAPWFVLLVIFIIFLLLAFQTLGVEEHGDTIFYWMIALIAIIGLGSLASVISSEHGFKSLSEENQTTVERGSEDVGFFQTLFNAKVLGMLLLLLIALFTVRNLTKIEKTGGKD